jgi:hypothetical protein
LDVQPAPTIDHGERERRRHGVPDDSTIAPAKPTNAHRRRVSFSLLSLVWLLTVVACGVGLWETARQVTPLRQEVARVREELGYFPIDDPNRILIKRLRSKVPNAWQWRLYLPPGRQYSVNCFHGRAPDPATLPASRWRDALRAAPPSEGVVRSQPFAAGESSFEALLTRYGGHWWLRMGAVNEDGQSISLAPRDRWLSDETAWVVASDVGYGRVNSFDPSQPIQLLHVEQNVHARDADDSGDGSALVDRLVIWIEPQ